jgi:predicted MPP superfamily phosphohydrolase
MRRIRRAAVVSAILLLAIGLVVSTWAHFSGGVGVGWAAAVALLALGYIPVAILGFRLQNPLLRAAAIPAAVCVGLLSFGFFGALACWALAGAARLLGVPVEDRLLGAGVFGLGLAAVIYGLFNAARIRVTRYTVALRHLPGPWEGKTGVLVSDIHLGNIRSVGFARRIVARINALRPDIVFIGGDMFDGARVDLDACVEPWSTLRAPAGAYFVTGNHDEFSDSSRIAAALRNVGVRVLDNEMVPVQGLQIVGIHDGAAREERTYREILARARLEPDRPSILLNHQPSHLSIPREAGISLQLSGHTHRGQFWPWTHLVARVYGPFAYGLHRSAGLQVITSSGVGTWGPPLRVATRSEIVLIRFTSAPAEPAGAGRKA